MTEPTASGSYRAIIEAARSMLAACDSFQTLVGVETEEAALAFVYRDVAIEPARPFARCYVSPYVTKEVGIGVFTDSGTVNWIIEAAAPETVDDDEQAEAWMANLLGDLCDELSALAGAGGRLLVRSIMADVPERAETAEGDPTPFWVGKLTAEVGAE